MIVVLVRTLGSSLSKNSRSCPVGGSFLVLDQQIGTARATCALNHRHLSFNHMCMVGRYPGSLMVETRKKA